MEDPSQFIWLTCKPGIDDFKQELSEHLSGNPDHQVVIRQKKPKFGMVLVECNEAAARVLRGFRGCGIVS